MKRCLEHGAPMGAPYCAKRISRVLRNATNTQRPLTLSPGMAASVKISTGKRRVIDFVLSPIAKATSEAGRER
jgi:hypothetical protein